MSHGNPDTNPFEEPYSDPLNPPLEYIKLQDGRLVIDAVNTAKQYEQSLQPRIEAKSLQGGDLLSFTYADGSVEDYAISSVEPRSYAFGSNDVISPSVVAQGTLPNGERYNTELDGTSISPSGTLMSLGKFQAGGFLNSRSTEGDLVSRTLISSFLLRRPDANGNLKEVILNKQARPETPSKSFKQAEASFLDAESRLQELGFNFSDHGKSGLGSNFMAMNNNGFVFADRGIGAQDSIFVYNAAQERLEGLHRYADDGILQSVTMHAAPHQVSRAEDYESWRDLRYFSGSAMYRMCGETPFVTRTWRHPSDESPLVTIVAGGNLVGERLRSGRENPEIAYSRFEVDFIPGNRQSLDVKDLGYWIENRKEIVDYIQGGSNMSVSWHKVRFRLGALDVSVPLNSGRQAQVISAHVRETLAARDTWYDIS